jgi:chitin synthase
MNSLHSHDDLTGRSGICVESGSKVNQTDSSQSLNTSESGSLIFCITLFNERLEFLTKTLASLVNNLLYMKFEMGRPRAFTACVMADGRSNLNCEVVRFFFELGLEDAFDKASKYIDLPEDEKGNDLTVSSISLPATDLLAHCNDDKWQSCVNSDPIYFKLLLCIKEKNAGKLDSHVRFFREILPDFSAEFVCQIDVGASLSPNCLAIMEDRMHDELQCVAIAPHVHYTQPEQWEALRVWQYMEVKIYQIANQSINDLFGYMEVLPGLCSMCRRDAISSLSISLQGKSNELPLYFRGDAAAGILECNAFLTEDRLLAWSLLVDTQPRAALHYARTAVVETDPCASMDELLKQRRRWTNGTLASRLYIAAHLGEVFRSSRHSPLRKCLILGVTLRLLTSALLQIIYPMLFILIFPVIIGELGGIIDAHNIHIVIAKLIALTCFFMWLALVYCPRPSRASSGLAQRKIMNLVAAISMSCVVAEILFVAMAPFWFMCAVLAAFLALCVSLEIINRNNRHWVLLSWLASYTLTQPGMGMYLISHAYANFSNVSWGTKDLNEPSRMSDSTWDKTRDHFLIGWASLIFVSLTLVLSFPPFVWRAVVEASFLLSIGRIILGSVAVCWPKRPHASQ